MLNVLFQGHFGGYEIQTATGLYNQLAYQMHTQQDVNSLVTKIIDLE